MQYPKDKIVGVCKKANIPTLYALPDTEDYIVFIVPRKLVSTTEALIRKALQEFIEVSCCVTSTEYDINEDYCIMRDYEWVV